MNRAPMPRTPWRTRRPPPEKKELNREQRLAARAERAIKNAPSETLRNSSLNTPQAQSIPGQAAIKEIAPRPKVQHHVNRRLLDMARGMPCLLRIAGTCNRDRATTVAAHSNWTEHGKGGARKADDHYSCWACSACHSWLDAGPAPRATKKAAFMRAHLDQVLMWRAITADVSRPDADRRAARWALEKLNATAAAFLETL